MFQDLIVLLYSLEYYYKTAHWSVKNSIYYSDHILLDRLSEEASKRIDQTAEKGIGLTQDLSIVHLPTILSKMHQKVSTLSYANKENSRYFEDALKLEIELLNSCKAFDNDKSSTGMRNLLGDIADEAEGRVYLIKQRLNKS